MVKLLQQNLVFLGLFGLCAQAMAADPPPPANPADVAAVLVKLADARKTHDVAALRQALKLPLRIAWRDNDGQGDCSVARHKSLKDPAKAADALAVTDPFLAALKRDKGQTHRGVADCAKDDADNIDYAKGEPAIVVKGLQATVTYEQSACEAGAGPVTYSLRLAGGVWRVTAYDDGCHY